jgi:hypothetical protein
MSLLERVRDVTGPLCPLERHVKQSLRALRPDEDEIDLLLEADREADWRPGREQR